MYKTNIVFNVLALALFSIFFASCTDMKDESDRGAHSERGALWFGPRLGKRSMKPSTEDNRQTFLRLLEAADALKFYYDQLPYERQADEPETKVTKKIIFTPKLGRSVANPQTHESLEFIPRLGRRLSEDMPATPADQEIYQPDPEVMESRTRYFSPRLGRTMSFSPRLGRELSYDYPTKYRVARSVNKTMDN
nr:neo-PBAN precursor [Bombyx mori]